MIWQSQVNHYFEHGGRFFCHWLVQFFCALAGKGWFAAVNALVWMACPPLLLRLSGSVSPWRDVTGMWWASLLTFLILNPLPYQPPVQINYLWMGMMVLGWILLFLSERKRGLPALLLIAIFSVLAGGSNESFSVPVCVAVAAYAVTRKFRLTREQWIAAIFFGAGTIALVAAPGNFRRMEMNPDAGWSLLHTLENMIPSLLLPAVFLLILTLCRNNRRVMVDIAGGRLGVLLLAVAVIVNYVMSAWFGFNSGVRMTCCGGLALAVLTIPPAKWWTGKHRHGLPVLIAVTLLLVGTLSWLRHDEISLHNRKYSLLQTRYHESADGIAVLPDDLFLYDSRDARLMRAPWEQVERNSYPSKPELRIWPESMTRLPLDKDTNMAVEFAPQAWILIRSTRRPATFLIGKRLLPGILDREAGVREADFSYASDIYTDSTSLWRAAVYINERPWLESYIRIEE